MQLERDAELRHAWQVKLRSLRYHLGFWLRRPIGRLAVVLLAASMIFPASATLTFHAHADGDHHHDHLPQLVADLGSSASGDTAGYGPLDDSTLHEHDPGTTVSTLPEPQALALAPVEPITSVAYGAASPSPCLARTPPHRPPIA